jgi:hypothetical protein
MKSGMQTFFFLLPMIQALSLSLSHSQKDPGSGKNSSRIRIRNAVPEHGKKRHIANEIIYEPQLADGDT